MKGKQVRAPDLEKYLEGRKHRYTTYEKGARMYSLPYWTFVKLAKDAKATWPLRKTAMVDIDLLDKYMDEHCKVVVDDKMEELVESITANGVLTAVLVRPDYR